MNPHVGICYECGYLEMRRYEPEGSMTFRCPKCGNDSSDWRAVWIGKYIRYESQPMLLEACKAGLTEIMGLSLSYLGKVFANPDVCQQMRDAIDYGTRGRD